MARSASAEARHTHPAGSGRGAAGGASGSSSSSASVGAVRRDSCEFFDALDTLEEVDMGDASVRGKRKHKHARENGDGRGAAAPASRGGDAPSGREELAVVVAEGGVPFRLCSKSWEQKPHVDRMAELSAATRRRIAREKGVDHDEMLAKRAQELDGAPEPPEMSLYDQAKGVIGRMKLGQDITRFELPATFLTPFSAIQASEDVLTIFKGSELDWNKLGDLRLDPVERFLNVLRLYLDMESVRAAEGTGGGSTSSFLLPPMKKPINSVLGETHRTRVDELDLVSEQVSHHPPITCWEAQHTAVGLRITGNLAPKPIFHGTSVQVALRGTLLFEFAHTGEVYTASIPDLYIRFFGLGGGYNETVGKIRFERVSAGNTGDNHRRLWADLHFKPRGSAGWKSKSNRLEGVVYESIGTSGGCGAGGGEGFGFLENFGHVDPKTKAMAAKWSAKGGAVSDARVIMTLKGHYNTEVFADGGRPFWRSAKRRAEFPMAATVPVDLETESHLVWGDLVRAIVAEDWKKADIAKKRVEVSQRKLMKVLKEQKREWEPRLFSKGLKEELGVLKGMYTLKPFVREAPPPVHPEWHEHIAKSVYL